IERVWHEVLAVTAPLHVSCVGNYQFRKRRPGYSGPLSPYRPFPPHPNQEGRDSFRVLALTCVTGHKGDLGGSSGGRKGRSQGENGDYGERVRVILRFSRTFRPSTDISRGTVISCARPGTTAPTWIARAGGPDAPLPPEMPRGSEIGRAHV